MKREPGFQPKFNYYRCERCHLCFVTVDVCAGVTPMFLNCRSPKGCGGRMVSRMYAPVGSWPSILQGRAPDGVWARPTRREIRKMRERFPALWRHVMDGGLVMRPPRKGDPTALMVAVGPDVE